MTDGEYQQTRFCGKYEKNAPVDFELLLDEFEGNKKDALTILESFLIDVGKKIGIMRHALSEGDARTIQKIAHGIRGVASGLTAERIGFIASDLERAGKIGSLEKSSLLLIMLDREHGRLKEFAKSFFENDEK